MSRTALILRGLPGSGKSTLAAALPGARIVSTDQFWTLGGAPYRFDLARLGAAIAWTRARWDEALASGATLVVLDNTCTREREWRWFADRAEDAGLTVHVAEIQRGTPAECAARTTHGVPAAKVEEMAARFERPVARRRGGLTVAVLGPGRAAHAREEGGEWVARTPPSLITGPRQSQRDP